MARWLSVFNLASGPRGGCKTLLVTVYQCQKLIEAYYQGFNVWSNYPVGFYHRDYRDGKVVYLKPQPLNMEAFYTFDKELVYGWVFVDEIDQYYDRQEWSTVTQKAINKVMTLIRHRHLSMMATIQSENWLNARGQFQLDTIVKCRDASFMPWGRARRLEQGEAANLTWIDKSGIRTGYTYEEWPRNFKNTLWGKWAWDKYDTDYQFDPLESQTRYIKKKKTKVLDYTGQSGGAQVLDDLDEFHSEKIDPNEVVLSHLISKLKDEGISTVTSPEFWHKAKEMGFEGSRYHWGKELVHFGVESRRSGKGIIKYEFEPIPV